MAKVATLLIAVVLACATLVSCLAEIKPDLGVLDVYPEEANNESLPSVPDMEEVGPPTEFEEEITLESAKATTFHSRRFLRKHSLLKGAGEAPEADPVEDKWFQQVPHN